MSGYALINTLDAATLARFARRTPLPVLRAAAMPPLGGLLVREIFRRMPSQMKPAAGAGDAVVRWNVESGANRSEKWLLVIKGGRATTGRDIEAGAPRTTLTLPTLELLRLATGAAQPMAMFQQGRIKISGDLWFAAQLAAMFEIPG